MTTNRQRQYLAALDIPLWQLRRSLAGQPQPATEKPSNHPDAACYPSLTEEGKPAHLPLCPPAPEEQSAEWVSHDDWTPLMDDEREPPAATHAVEVSPAPLTTANRAAHIAQMGWDELTAAVPQCTACSLCTTRTQTVFGVGNRQAEWLIIGEAPGGDEDRLGEPFVGRAGKLLNPMLQAIGLKREQVFIANILKCRPPENRDPTPTEAANCRPFLEQQIALIRPRIILAVGRIAAQNLLNTDTQIGKLRGRVHRFEPTGIPLIVTYHPAYLLRSPREKRKSWDDLRLARRTLVNEPPNPASRPAAP
ncbi:MAG: uracil-DNA glycosylase [Candidatus Competibacteraceae bacterium]